MDYDSYKSPHDRNPHADVARAWFEDMRRRVETKDSSGTWVPAKYPSWLIEFEYRFAEPVDSRGVALVIGKKYQRPCDKEEFVYVGRVDEINFVISKTLNKMECSQFPWHLDGSELVEEMPEESDELEKIKKMLSDPSIASNDEFRTLRPSQQVEALLKSHKSMRKRLAGLKDSMSAIRKELNKTH